MLAHGPLAIKRMRRTKHRVALQQHLADIVQRATMLIADLVKMFRLAELRQQIGHIGRHLAVADPDALAIALPHNLVEQPP